MEWMTTFVTAIGVAIIIPQTELLVAAMQLGADYASLETVFKIQLFLFVVTTDAIIIRIMYKGCKSLIKSLREGL